MSNELETPQEVQPDFRTIDEGTPFGILICNGKEYIDTANDYPAGFNPVDREFTINGEPVEASLVGYGICDTTCEITVLDTPESRLECTGLSIVAFEVIGSRPPRRPR